MLSAMISSLDDKNASVRENALYYIGNYIKFDADAFRAIPKICELALGDKEWSIRKGAIRIIARVLEANRNELDELTIYDDWTGKDYTLRKHIMHVLEDILKGDPIAEVRSSAAKALGFVDESSREDAIYILLKALRDVDSDVRASAVRALGRIGDQRVLGELSRLAFDPNEEDTTAIDAFCSFRLIILRSCGQEQDS